MKTIQFQVTDEEFSRYQTLAAAFYKGRWPGRAFDEVAEFAAVAVHVEARRMTVEIEAKQARIQAVNVVKGPWNTAPAR